MEQDAAVALVANDVVGILKRRGVRKEGDPALAPSREARDAFRDGQDHLAIRFLGRGNRVGAMAFEGRLVIDGDFVADRGQGHGARDLGEGTCGRGTKRIRDDTSSRA